MALNPKKLTLEPWLQNPFDKQIFTWMVVVVCLVLALDILAGKGSIPLTIRVNYSLSNHIFAFTSIFFCQYILAVIQHY